MTFIGTIRKAESPTLASVIGGSHLMPPITDINNDKYNVKLASAWCTALEMVGLGTVAMTSKETVRFCRTEYESLSVDNKQRLHSIGVGEEYQIKKLQKL